MFFKDTNIAKIVRFRRWTRKAYAVFASLGKTISIGNLRVAMAGQTLFRGFERLDRIFTEQPDEAFDSEQDPELLSTDFLFTTEIISVPASQYAEAVGLMYIYCINQTVRAV
ncbi:MAG: hypothetical protein VB046_11820 [Paludibacter sp.]|jgi:hypothetical protein|nr:hypothetical protein [Paludibacter sp.]